MKNLILILSALLVLSCSCKKERQNVIPKQNEEYPNDDKFDDTIIFKLCLECSYGILRMESDTVVQFNIIEVSKNYSIVEFPITIPLQFKKDTVEYRTVTYPNPLEENPEKCDSIVLYNDYGYPRFVFTRLGGFVEDWRNTSENGMLKKLVR